MFRVRFIMNVLKLKKNGVMLLLFLYIFIWYIFLFLCRNLLLLLMIYLYGFNYKGWYMILVYVRIFRILYECELLSELIL